MARRKMTPEQEKTLKATIRRLAHRQYDRGYRAGRKRGFFEGRREGHMVTQGQYTDEALRLNFVSANLRTIRDRLITQLSEELKRLQEIK